MITLAPGVIWGDSAKFALEVNNLHLGYHADSHPLFIVLGKMFSLLPLEPAYSLNLLSAVCASIAVFLVYLIIIEITNSKISAVAGALALCVSHAFWLHAVIAEVYDLNAAFIASVIFFVLKWRKDINNYTPLYIAAFLCGLGLTNHRIIIFDIIGAAIFVLVTEPKIIRRVKVILSILASLLTGSLLLIYIMVRDILLNPVTLVADKFTAEGYKMAVMKYSPKILEETGLYLSYLFYQFPLIGFVLGFTGLIAIFKNDRKLALLFSLLIGINALFFFKFGPSLGTSKFTFYISAYMVFSLLIGYGFFSMKEALAGRGYPVKQTIMLTIILLFLVPVLGYSFAPSISKSLKIDLLHARTISYRDNDEFFLDPNKKNYYGAERFALEVFNEAGPDSIIFADYTPYTVLKYFQEVKGLRKDLMIVLPGSKKRAKDGTVKFNIMKDIVLESYGSKYIYLADIQDETYYRLSTLKIDYDFVPGGILFRIVKKQGLKPFAN
jgi:hypothetical protein